ncbi:hypothetical protein Cch01nite_01350 [Cellulomonas chitinilytica]|uniref:DUF952 domain-containing protein n=1 Tax=Cellulomonas chitinilytica TaxID=398759 RepID=A0A919P0G4_9CELL|nr:DUF952 domain-containing protein [Cellulomonas chitinilytica]GIG19411.1 hypothetical protein Cch01nite_01350 [Cellulomonas chitinilytica]
MGLWHLAHRADWDAACAAGTYRVSTRGRTLDEVGFVHASRPAQLAHVAEAVYADDPEDLVVLVLDEALVGAAGVPVIEEDGGTGELFPHVYGPIDPSWVTEVLPARFDEHGRFRVDVPG